MRFPGVCTRFALACLVHRRATSRECGRESAAYQRGAAQVDCVVSVAHHHAVQREKRALGHRVHTHADHVGALGPLHDGRRGRRGMGGGIHTHAHTCPSSSSTMGMHTHTHAAPRTLGRLEPSDFARPASNHSPLLMYVNPALGMAFGAATASGAMPTAMSPPPRDVTCTSTYPTSGTRPGLRRRTRAPTNKACTKTQQTGDLATAGNSSRHLHAHEAVHPHEGVAGGGGLRGGGTAPRTQCSSCHRRAGSAQRHQCPRRPRRRAAPRSARRRRGPAAPAPPPWPRLRRRGTPRGGSGVPPRPTTCCGRSGQGWPPRKARV